MDCVLKFSFLVGHPGPEPGDERIAVATERGFVLQVEGKTSCAQQRILGLLQEDRQHANRGTLFQFTTPDGANGQADGQEVCPFLQSDNYLFALCIVTI